MGIRTVIALGLLAPLAAVFAQDSNDVVDLIDSRYESTAKIARDIWEYAEVGYQETKSSNLLQTTLSAEGFSIQAGVANIPTAFVATYGSGEPVIAILAEFDALPGINQDSVPTRLLIDEKAAGHACGHNLFAAGSIGAAIAVKHWLEESGSSGTLKLLGTPAEEGGSGKVYMVRDGLFDDVDVALTWHPGDNNSASASTTLANRSGKFRFRGISAHAAAAPENARSALDGVEAFNHMINMMREHVPQETRIHYVITDGGNAPNVVPDFAEVYYYVRHPDAEIVKDIWARLENAAKGAAMGTGVDVDWEIIHGNYAVMLNETLSVMMDEKLRLVGGVQYNEYEQSFAEELYRSFDRPKHALGSQEEIQPYTVDQTYASTDVGDVSVAVPTVGLNTATWVPGTSAHSWQSVAASGMTIGYKGAQVAAKTMALAAIELMENEALIIAARLEFETKRGADFEYDSLLGDRPPPLDYRN
ncbi:MAG: amidohydrolase [Woeseia sp.]|jgi:aminobenzoyl-glutamate utilization protein B|nr:amidohydrolase [Woeseia sp.]